VSRQTRSTIIDQLEKKLKTPVLTYVTGDRPGLETQVGSDQLPLFRRHLEAIGKVDHLTLVIYTRGGDTNLPWPLMNFVREHARRVTAAVPFSSHSAGTLLTLGADEILMTRYATLSPIDPTVTNAFNPQDPTNPMLRMPIAVEDVLAFMELAQKHGDSTEAFKRLAESVHPLALGNVQRSINMIRALARRMLKLSSACPPDDEVEAMITRLTTEFYTHAHQISRREAKEIGLPVKTPSPIAERLLLQYYDALCADLELMSRFDPPTILRAAAGAQAPLAPLVVNPAGPPPAPQPMTPPVAVSLERAYIETRTTCDAYITRGTISHQAIGPQQMPPGMQVQMLPQQPAVAFEIATDRWELVD
jgi:hypothetical protein